MPHSCLLPELSKATSACSETLKTSLYIVFFLYFCPHSVYVKETLEDLEKWHWPETAVFVFRPPLASCV